MHGIRYYSSCMAFPEFDYYHVWGEYHLEQLKMMHASAGKFIISGNPIHRAFRRRSAAKEKSSRSLLIMFEYLLYENKELLSLVSGIVSKFEPANVVAVRSHYQEMELSSLFIRELESRTKRKFIVDDPSEISLEDSIFKSEMIAGCYTNALTDAWIAGKKCVYINSPDGRIPLQEYHGSANIMVYASGADISRFLASPVIEDEKELYLKNRFSKLNPQKN